MIVGSPLPKRPKQESLTSALVGAANAFASAISPTPNATGVTGALQLLQTQPSVSGTGVSLGRAADVRMSSYATCRGSWTMESFLMKSLTNKSI